MVQGEWTCATQMSIWWEDPQESHVIRGCYAGGAVHHKLCGGKCAGTSGTCTWVQAGRHQAAAL